MNVIKATANDANEMFDLIQEVIATGRTLWNEYYPTMEDMKQDAMGRAYLFRSDSGELLATISVTEDETAPGEEDGEGKGFEYKWMHRQAVMLSRLAVKPKYWGGGMGKTIMKYMENLLREEGHKAIHIMVSTKLGHLHPIYKSVGYIARGTEIHWGEEYMAYELEL